MYRNYINPLKSIGKIKLLKIQMFIYIYIYFLFFIFMKIIQLINLHFIIYNKKLNLTRH